jgi:outer membrane protein
MIDGNAKGIVVMRSVRLSLAGLIVAICSPTAVSFAADQPSRSPTIDAAAPETRNAHWFFRAGPAGLLFDSSASITLAGSHLAGASLTASDNTTLILEGGYFVTPDMAIVFSGGIPPQTTFTGNGTIAGLGELGKATYGPAVLSVIKGLGSLKPYVGVGPAYAFIFSTTDGAVGDLHVDGNWGFAVQAGFDYRMTKNWSSSADVKYISLKVHAHGELFNEPVEAHVTLDPTVVSLGLSYHW